MRQTRKSFSKMISERYPTTREREREIFKCCPLEEASVRTPFGPDKPIDFTKSTDSTSVSRLQRRKWDKKFRLYKSKGKFMETKKKKKKPLLSKLLRCYSAWVSYCSHSRGVEPSDLHLSGRSIDVFHGRFVGKVMCLFLSVHVFLILLYVFFSIFTVPLEFFSPVFFHGVFTDIFLTPLTCVCRTFFYSPFAEFTPLIGESEILPQILYDI